VVEAVGEGVKKVKRDDRVYTAKTLTGAYAEYALALEEQVHPLSAKIDFKQGAGIWVPYGTAHHMRCITRRKRTLPRPHWYTAQVAVWALRRSKSPAPRGLKVLGTAGTAKGLEMAKREGAHQVFDHRKAAAAW
jgi:NADPH2:quinone reductase